MSRTNEKTYLQTLIQDPDRRTNLHQLGCDYLSFDENVWKLFDHLELTPAKIKKEDLEAEGPDFEPGYAGWDYCENFSIDNFSLRKNIEKKLSRPLFSNSFIIGYADLTLQAHWQYSWVHKFEKVKKAREKTEIFRERPEERDIVLRSENSFFEKKIFIEVKGSPQHPHDILQQMQTYMSYFKADIFLLATMYPIPKSEKQVYLDHGIKHVWVDPEKAAQFVAMKNKEIDREEF